jgi:GntR family transcriptional regulator, transcriptional repressor for pyruvate dehydrogenase complex
MSFQEVVRNPVHLQVADQLREAILDGRLAPGEPLPPERELSRSFGVSRASVREALRALQAEGLIAGGRAPAPAIVAEELGGPARDALVNLLRLNRVALADLVDFRCLLETGAVRRAAQRRDSEGLAEARWALDEMRDAEITIERFDEADVRFHLALVRASGNEAMRLVMLALRHAVAEYLLEALRAERDPDATLRRLTDEHAAILDAVEKGRPERAAKLVDDHIRGFYRAG